MEYIDDYNVANEELCKTPLHIGLFLKIRYIFKDRNKYILLLQIKIFTHLSLIDYNQLTKMEV